MNFLKAISTIRNVMQEENRGPVSGGSNTPEGKKLDHVTIVYESKEVK